MGHCLLRPALGAVFQHSPPLTTTADPTRGGLTLGVPGGHGDDAADTGLSHGADDRAHGERVPRHTGEEGGWKAEAGHDHILPSEVSLQTVRGENICLHHLGAEGQIQGVIKV